MDNFEMFSDEGNNSVVRMLKGLQVEVVERTQLSSRLKAVVGRIAVNHPEVNDTEPESMIVDWVNKNICGPRLWLPITRNDLF